MYILSALLMLFRGGVDALMMRRQLATPEMTFLASQHYNEVFYDTRNHHDFVHGDAVYARHDEYRRPASDRGTRCCVSNFERRQLLAVLCWSYALSIFHSLLEVHLMPDGRPTFRWQVMNSSDHR